MLIRCKLKATHPAMLPYSHGWQLYVTTLHDLCVFQYSIAAAIITSNVGQVSARKTFYHNQITSVPKIRKPGRGTHEQKSSTYNLVFHYVSSVSERIHDHPDSQYFTNKSLKRLQHQLLSTAIHCYPLHSTSIPSMISIQDAHGLIDPIPLGHLAPSVPSRPSRVSPNGPDVGSATSDRASKVEPCTVVEHVSRFKLFTGITWGHGKSAWQGFHDDEAKKHILSIYN